VNSYLKIPARIEIDQDDVTIKIPMERIHLSIRKAGLDRDPGWIPWLQKYGKIVFEE